MTDYAALRQQIALDRGGYCEVCEMVPFTELHHCLIHRKKGHPELDTVENLEAVCSDCHLYANSWEHRVKFWKRQCARYGREHMLEWLDGLGLKEPPRFDLVEIRHACPKCGTRLDKGDWCKAHGLPAMPME